MKKCADDVNRTDHEQIINIDSCRLACQRQSNSQTKAAGKHHCGETATQKPQGKTQENVGVREGKETAPPHPPPKRGDTPGLQAGATPLTANRWWHTTGGAAPFACHAPCFPPTTFFKLATSPSFPTLFCVSPNFPPFSPFPTTVLRSPSNRQDTCTRPTTQCTPSCCHLPLCLLHALWCSTGCTKHQAGPRINSIQ